MKHAIQKSISFWVLSCTAGAQHMYYLTMLNHTVQKMAGKQFMKIEQSKHAFATTVYLSVVLNSIKIW